MPTDFYWSFQLASRRDLRDKGFQSGLWRPRAPRGTPFCRGLKPGSGERMTECSAGRRLDEELWARESGLCRLDDGAAGDGRSMYRIAQIRAKWGTQPPRTQGQSLTGRPGVPPGPLKHPQCYSGTKVPSVSLGATVALRYPRGTKVPSVLQWHCGNKASSCQARGNKVPSSLQWR